jgi:hypothetical protein
MPKSNLSLVVPFSLLLATMTGGAALAQAASNTIYSARFVCGTHTADDDVVRGMYASSIGIHNPQTISVSFTKKIVVDVPEGQTPPPPKTFKDTLGPDLAERVDCPLIDQVLGVNAATPVEGFVVFEVPKLSPPQGKKQPIPLFLDVVGKHTSRPLLPGASSIQIFRYVPTTNISD